MNFTDSQSDAIREDGNLLVVAGAGTGKTRTLVERCVQRLIKFADADLPLEEKLTINNVLIVTFTDAAATEVRRRVRERIEEEVAATGNGHLRDQLELLETAQISTLHSFCFRLIRQHFYELGLDPGMGVLTKQQADVLRSESLDNLFQEIYSSKTSQADAVRALLIEHFQGKDERVRQVILQLHHYTQTRPHPQAWYQSEIEKFSNPEPGMWRTMFKEETLAWMKNWILFLRTLSKENSNAHACADILEQYAETDPFTALDLISKRDLPECWVKGKKTAHKAEFGKLFDEANFLNSLTPHDGYEPLAEDWVWFTRPTRTVLALARDFEIAYTRAKYDRGSLDFHDLEQFALQLLWDEEKQAPSEPAKQWQERFHFVFVDEYQDINAAQDKIICCLSRDESNGNRFLVGDVKQSIYRFRQADPTIFRKYMAQAKTGQWKQFFLSHNFRSEERILRFVNQLFTSIMREDLGGISYDANAALQYGRKAEGAGEAKQASKYPEVEAHLLVDGKDGSEPFAETNEQSENEPGDTEDLETAEREALWVGQQLQNLQTEGAKWKDMVILLRSLKNKVETYARVFEHLGIPLQLKRNSFYSSIEVLDLLNLLTILDNPLQDISLLATLRSPFGGFTASELAKVRLALHYRNRSFWEALLAYPEKNPEDALAEKCARIIATINHWRDLGKHLSISARLDVILQETLYADWILTQPRGKQ
ncbi:MAG: UvrD-helicase domain-containing protein, partial [Verrucomicrobiales bacterium]